MICQTWGQKHAARRFGPTVRPSCALHARSSGVHPAAVFASTRDVPAPGCQDAVRLTCKQSPSGTKMESHEDPNQNLILDSNTWKGTSSTTDFLGPPPSHSSWQPQERGDSLRCCCPNKVGGLGILMDYVHVAGVLASMRRIHQTCNTVCLFHHGMLVAAVASAPRPNTSARLAFRPNQWDQLKLADTLLSNTETTELPGRHHAQPLLPGPRA